MAWTNGYRLISNTGTWLEFFNAVKSAMQENTGYDIINGDTDYNFTIDFGNGFTCVVSDSTITDESVTSRSNSLKLMTYQNGVSRYNSTINYASLSYAQTDSATRTIPLFTYSNDKLKILGFESFSSYSYVTLRSSSFIECKCKDIATGEEKSMFKTHNSYLYDLDGNSFNWFTNFTSNSSNGIVLLNNLVTKVSTIAGYLPDIYNCTTVQPYSYYLINNQKYFAIDTNLLIKE